MVNLDYIRSSVIGTFSAFHDANFSSIPVNYPNRIVTDIETQEDPFINVELIFDTNDRAAIGEKDSIVTGTLSVTYYIKEGEGTHEAYAYTDSLNNNLGLSTIDNIYYSLAKPITVTTFTGWYGVMNLLKFKYL